MLAAVGKEAILRTPNFLALRLVAVALFISLYSASAYVKVMFAPRPPLTTSSG